MKSVEKVLLILNPVAGKGRSVEILGTYLPELAGDGSTVTVYFTQEQGDAPRYIASHGDEYDRVIIAGGDGSLNELVTGALSGEVKSSLGYLPTGTVCDFAASIGLPKDMAEAASIARFGKEQVFDAGRFNEENYFVYVASFGAFTDVSYDTPSELKNNLGRLAYVANALKNLTNFKAISLEMKADEIETNGEFLFGAILNTKQMAGLIRFDEADVSLNDGLFEVLLVRYPKSAGEVTTIINSLMNQDYSSPQLVFLKAKDIRISFQEEMAWTLDGEFGGSYKDVSIEVLPQAWKMTC